MKVGQYVLIKFPQWTGPVFARIKNLGSMVMAKPIDVVIQKNWGANYLATNMFQGRGSVVTMLCPTSAVIEVDWYNDYYLKLYKHDRDAQMVTDYYGEGGKALAEPNRTFDIKYTQASEQELMRQTFEMVMLEDEWTKLNTKYDEDLAKSQAKRIEEDRKREARVAASTARAQRKADRANAKIPKKGDIVTVTNVRGYRGKKYEMIVAAVGPAEFQQGDMIRDLVIVRGDFRIPLTLPASYVGKLGGTQALAFYLKGFPEKIIYDIVQWTRTGNANFIKKLPPAPEPMQVEEVVDVVEANKIQRITEEQQRNQQDTGHHKNDILYTANNSDVARGGYDDAPKYDYYILAVVGPGNYPNGIVIEDVLVDGKLLTLRADYKGKLTRMEGIAFYMEGIFTNPRWLHCNWRKANMWNRLYKKRTNGGWFESTPLRF